LSTIDGELFQLRQTASDVEALRRAIGALDTRLASCVHAIQWTNWGVAGD